MTTKRVFHVELTFYRTVEVKLSPDDIPQDEDADEFAIEEALLTAFNSKCVVDEDYEIGSVIELTEKSAA